MEEPEKACRYCSGPMPDGRRSEYCSVACVKARRKGYTAVRPHGQVEGTCPQCGADFERIAPKQVFCTKQCQSASDADKRKGEPRTCGVCSTTFKVNSNSKTCSPECRKKFMAMRLLEKKQANFGPPRTCRQCTKVFTWNTEFWIDYCSRACRSEAKAETKKRHGHNRRAKRAKVTIEQFSPTYILKRDKYICQACGAKTKPEKKSTHPLYPNVDHIVPLSMGGEHSKKNCRCVCASCNSKKGNGVLNDQLLLFG